MTYCQELDSSSINLFLVPGSHWRQVQSRDKLQLAWGEPNFSRALPASDFSWSDFIQGKSFPFSVLHFSLNRIFYNGVTSKDGY